MNINDLSHSKNIFTTQSNIALNDVKIFDFQNECFVEFFEKYLFVYFENVNVVEIFVKLVKLNISNFCLALNLWCDKKEIKKRVYADLLQVLRLLKISDIDKLLNRLFTLQS
jgi:hypothetical protein